MPFNIYANKQELQNLPEDSEYLFCNFQWKHHPAYQHCMELSFSDEDQDEAIATYHELWKVRLHLPSLQRNWV